MKKLKSTIEIKYRGPLTKLQTGRILKYLKAKENTIKASREQLFYLESTAFPSIGDFNWGTARMSIKISETAIDLRLKEGNPAIYKREVYKVKISKTQAANLFYIVSRLGMKDAFYRPVFRRQCQHGNLIVIIKQKCVMGDHFEIQLKDNTESAQDELRHFLKKFNLRCWTETQYKNRITKLMKTSPAMPILDVLGICNR